MITQDTFGVAESVEAGDHFGVGLASGDFGGDDAGDLAIGADSDSVDGQQAAGLAPARAASATWPRPTTSRPARRCRSRRR